MKNGTCGQIVAKDGKRLAYLWEPPNGPPLYLIKLSEPPVGPVPGPSAFQGNAHYAINVMWPDQERKRCLPDIQTSTRDSNPVQGSSSNGPARDNGLEVGGSKPYTSDEMAWIKKNFGNEFSFLRLHGLKIHNDEEREEGRAIARALMTDDDDDDAKEGENQEEEGRGKRRRTDS